MLYREIIAVCSQIHTKHINTLCGQNVELLSDKLVTVIIGFILLVVKNFIFDRLGGCIAAYWDRGLERVRG